MKNLEKIKKFQMLSVDELELINNTYSLLEKAEIELEEQAEQYCHWVQQDSEFSEDWLACDDKLFCITSGSPTENGMLFCPYCGKNIVEHSYNESTEEQEIDEDYC